MNNMKLLSDEQFEDKVIQAVRVAYKIWERRRIIIECDSNFNCKTYQRIPVESGFVCNMCSERGEKDKLDLSGIFKAYNEALKTGDKIKVIEAIDEGLRKTREKVKEVYGKEI